MSRSRLRAFGGATPAAVLLYTGFGASGFGCALPGVLLPLLLVRWHWTDRQGGLLFLLITAGSALGPLVLRRNLRVSVVCGHALAALSLLAWWLHPGTAYPAAALFGLGLGLVMTGISLLAHQLATQPQAAAAVPPPAAGAVPPSAARAVPPPAAAAALVRLNFVWALGALCCPSLAAFALRHLALGGVLALCVAVFGCLAVGSLLALPARRRRTAAAASPRFWSVAGIPASLLLATALATGVEASGGAWLAAYAQRYRHGFAVTFSAPALFWAGLLSSRALGWLPDAPLGGARALRLLLLLVALATATLLWPLGSAGLLAASFLLGFGLGPLYPELLARVLARRETSTVFALAGLASALVPWATGLVSSATGSLRRGFLVPVGAALVLLYQGWRSTGEGAAPAPAPKAAGN